LNPLDPTALQHGSLPHVPPAGAKAVSSGVSAGRCLVHAQRVVVGRQRIAEIVQVGLVARAPFPHDDVARIGGLVARAHAVAQLLGVALARVWTADRAGVAGRVRTRAGAVALDLR
jgi:hypothetical protein